MRVSLDVMHSKPGIYIVVGNRDIFLVEVDASGICYQLSLATFKRDGELRRGHWNVSLVQNIFGPLFREPPKP